MNGSLWKSIASFAIALSPAILHIIDRFLERYSPISRRTLASLMREDDRIKKAVQSEVQFETIAGYFDFERGCHFVFAVSIFNIVSLFFAQAACTGKWLEAKPVTLIMMILMFAFLVIFFINLYNGSIEVASVDTKDWWKRPVLIKWWQMVAFIAFGIVIITDVVLHWTCVLAEGAHH